MGVPATEKKRNINLDIIRVLAVFLVVNVHFCLNISFGKLPAGGGAYYLLLTSRTFSMICVPLFMLMSGYLMKNKRLEKAYYKGILRVLWLYLLAAIACILFRVYYMGQSYNFIESVIAVLDFTGANYAWYVEMYIGLFLLIPFLNICYNSLDTRKKKLWLIITMIILTVAPTVFNIFNFEHWSWWLDPASNRDHARLFPDWWTGLYPVTYYFIGCYLKDYPIRLKRWVHGLLIAAATFATSAYLYYRNHGDRFRSEIFTKYNALGTLVIAVLVFSFIVNMNTERVPGILRRLITYISGISFSMYLLSYIADVVVYEYINSAADGIGKAKYIFIAVPIVFISSAVMASITEGLYKAGMAVMSKIKKNGER